MNAVTPLEAFDAIRAQSAEAVIGQSGLNHQGLAAEVRRRFGSVDVAQGGLLQQPVIEAAPGYVEHEETMEQLSGGLLHPATIAALDGEDGDRPGRYRFRREWRPYAHQVEAWRKLSRAGAPNSILVTSGTGSGKTECFLVPIIDDLVRQSRTRPLEKGVQAVVLYPLNALIASQEERLRDWTAPFAGRLRFALYNGLLPNEVKNAVAQKRPEMVHDRMSLRASPPPILVTNVTMLEYMLLRAEDEPILRKSQGKLRYVVLDEAHSYVGAQAAEIALLLRRVCLAFGTDPKDVRFVATSATIGGPDAQADLARFLADVSGAPADRVSVIRGRPHWPELPDTQRPGPIAPEALMAADQAEAYDTLASSAALRPLLIKLREGAVGWTDLESAAARVGLSTAGLAAAMSSARKDGIGLSPLRIHGFHRAVPGLWSCIDPACFGIRPRDWPFGAVAAHDGERCPACNGPTFEVLSCNSCGEPYIDVLERDGGRLVRPARARPDDEFAADAEATGETETAPDEAEAEKDPDGPAGFGIRRLLLTRAAKGDRPIHVDLDRGIICDGPGPERTTFRCVAFEKTPDHCIACGSKRLEGGAELIRSFRFGAPFLLGNLVPALLEGAAAADAGGVRERAAPLSGRQLLSFTDSRQGTARLAAKLQIGAERNFVRSFVYHAVQDALGRVPDLTTIDNDVAMLEAAVATMPDLKTMLDAKRAERASKLAEAEGGLAWTDMVQRLAERDEVDEWLRELWRPRDPDRFSSPTTLANFLLLREFARRPRKANSLETMGLARLRFPTVAASKTPKALADLGGTTQDWHAFLDTILTHLVRANSAVRLSWDDKRWIQPKASLTDYVKHPDADLLPRQRRWPSIPQGSAPLKRLTRPALLLIKGFGVDPEDAAARARLQEILDAAWTALLPVMTVPGAVNHALDFSTATIAPVTSAAACPVTRRVLDVTFRDLSPYGVDGIGVPGRRAEPISMPRHPAPFLGATTGRDQTQVKREVADWLASDPAVTGLRERGLWSDLHDRTALFADYYRSAEHSAQQAPTRLRSYEAAFKQGNINVLNCSTTMEMGVDIGSVSHVLMTNVPPSIASYRQRVGRAGRRRQAMSLAFTFCKDRPLDRLAFLDPVAFLGRSMRAPRVALDSSIIVQRHINALLFSAFARSQRADALKMQAGPFFGCPSGAGAPEQADSPAARFVDFVSLESTRAALEGEIAKLTRASALDGDPGVFDDAIAIMRSIHDGFAHEWRALQETWAKGQAGDTAANRGLTLQLRRMCEDYLLSVLSGRGFLPSHGFPTGVVSFVCRIDEPEAAAAEGERPRLKAFPQRQLDRAMQEYAPGSEVVLDGLVHRSAGVTLNWRRPATEDGIRDIQNLLWRWHCNDCGESGTARGLDPDGSCENCGAAGLAWFEYLQPAGFAADLRQKPHADPDEVSFVPADVPAIGLQGAPWSALANPAQGRRRESRAGTVFHCNSGEARAGYEICLHCGRAQPDEAVRSPDDDGAWLHPPLLGKPDADDYCPGSRKPFGIKRQLRLGYEIRTDVFEVQPTGLASRGAGLALAVALREALAQRLGVGFEEMGVAAARRSSAAGGRISAFVFDRADGGSGFSVQAGPLFDELLPTMASILDCTVAGCVAGCPACVLTNDLTEDDARTLNRQAALDVVRSLAASGMPDAIDAAVPDARLTADVLDALARAKRPEARRLVLRIAAPIDVAALAAWRPANIARRWLEAQRQVIVSVPPGTVSAMDGTARPALRDWLRTWGAALEEAPDAVLPNGAKVLAEVVGEDRTMVLASRDVAVFDADAGWGRPTVVPVVQFVAAEPTLTGTSVPFDALRPPTGAKVRTITTELDGSLRSFAKRMAGIIREALAEAGAPDAPVTSVAYADRYLNSPLTARMAIETMALLAGSSAARPVLMTVMLRALKPGDRPSWRISDDWMRDQDRLAVMSQLAARIGLRLDATVGTPPHGRSITLGFEDGRSAQIILDQGFGAWATSSAPQFAFNESPARQVSNLAMLDPRIQARGATYIVVQVT